MTLDRPEVVLSASMNGKDWVELDFLYKAGTLSFQSVIFQGDLIVN